LKRISGIIMISKRKIIENRLYDHNMIYLWALLKSLNLRTKSQGDKTMNGKNKKLISKLSTKIVFGIWGTTPI